MEFRAHPLIFAVIAGGIERGAFHANVFAGGDIRSGRQDVTHLAVQNAIQVGQAFRAAVIRMERTRCFGSCPAYILIIYGDGRVEYISKEDKKAAAKQGTIAPGAVKALLAQFASAKFLSLPDYLFEECTCRQCTDLPSTITEINVQGTTHRVRHDYGCGCAPEALFELESAIDKAANVEQWTGDTSKRGPAGTTCFQPKDLKH